MKRDFTKLVAAFALLAVLFSPLGMWGQTRTQITWDASQQNYTNAQDVTSATFDSNISAAFEGGKYYNTGAAVRVYGGKTFTITASNNNTISEIAITFGTGDGSNTITANTGAYSDGTWTGNASSVVFSVGGSTGHRRLKTFAVTYSGGGSTTYTVTLNQTTGGTISATPTSAAQGTTITLTATPASGYTFGSWSTSPEVAINNNSFSMPASNVTVSASWTQNGGGTGGDEQWVLTSLSELTSSDVFVIVGNGSYAMTNDNGTSNPPATSAVTITGDQITSTVAANIQWTLSGNADDGYTFYPNGTTSTWLYCSTTNATGSNNNMKVGTGSRKVFLLTTVSGDKYLVTNDNYSNRYVCIYDNSDWRGYVQASIVSTNTTFYKKVGSATHSSISASNLSIAFDATSGTIGYTITNPVAGITLAADCDANWINDITVGAESVTFTCSVNNTTLARTATFTLTYEGAADKTVTVTQAASSVGYAILPFAFDSGRADIANTNGLTQENIGTDYASSPKLRFEKGNKDNDGKYSTLILHFNERPGELSYDILGNSFSGGTFKVQVSTDGVTYSDWATYTQLTTTLQHITFNNLDENVRYIKWIYTQKVSGNVALGNIKLKKYEAPQPYTLSINNLQDVRVYASAPGYSMITNGQNFTIPSVTVVTLIVQHSDDYVLDEILVLDEGNNSISLTPVPQTQNQWTFYMPNSNVTVSASVVAAHPPVHYKLASSIVSGKRYIIVGQKNGQYYAMGTQKTNNRLAKLISVEDNTATVTRSDVLEFTITSLQAQNFYSIYDETEPGYLYAGDDTENRLLTKATLDEDGEWEITINAQTGVASVVASNSNNINVMQFNSNYELFNCYSSASQNPVYLYQIEDGFPLEITGYTGTKDHYYLISTPVTVDPATVDGMVTGDYDLYYYDPSQNLEWINYKGDANLGHPGHFNLVPGTGYLYAKAATSEHSTYTFNLSGELYDGTGDIPIVNGWNLIGNPYSVEAEIDFWEGFLVINEGLDESEFLLVDDNNIIQPMQAIMCYVENSDDYSGALTFSRQAKGKKHSGLSLNLSGSGTAILDRAVVRFGEGSMMPKLQLNPNHTKIYIPQNGKDYAVVRGANDGELPVSFKAERNGTYTLSMNAVGLDLDYLHLIDNMTGADVDLLVTPSYTFEARTKDYESRFKLVFSQQAPEPVEGPSNFAFFNGSAWTISNEGPATLQVIDVMGRIVSTQSISGNATVSINESAGIYTLRLVNGDDVKVQKVVVR